MITAGDKSGPEDDKPAAPQGQEKVEDRPMVSIVTPDDYPETDREDGDATGV
jgi:hypothetical protein